MRSHDPNTLANSSIHIHQPSIKKQQQTSSSATNRNNNKLLSTSSTNNDDSNRQLLKCSEYENGKNRQTIKSNDNDGNSENSSSVSYTPAGICGPKILLKFIDSSVDSDLPPSLSALKQITPETKLLSASDRNLSTVSITKSVEFRDDLRSRNNSMSDGVTTGNRKQHEVDSAVEESTSSSENNQVCYIVLMK